ELLRTKDGGASWKVQQKMGGARRMLFKNTIGFIIGDAGSLYKSTHNGDGWNRLTLGTSDNLTGLTVLHEDTVFTTSEKKLFKSFDGGKTWSTLTIPNTSIKDSYFVSSLEGHVVSGDGKILKTTDGGISWRVTSSTTITPSNYFRIKFVNTKVGFATRAHSYVFSTTDGGETWSNSPKSLDAGYVIHFLNEKIGFIAGDDGAMHKTVDGGLNWKWAGFAGRTDANDIYGVYFVNENIGFATGLRGRIIKTLDGGITWKEYAPTYLSVRQAQLNPGGIGYLLGGYGFYKTYDGGSKWESIGPPLVGAKTGQFDFVSDDVGYAIAGGEAGTSATSASVYKTIDGGKSWSKTHAAGSLAMEDLYCLDFINENVGFVGGGYNFKVGLKTVDGGKTWSPMQGVESFEQIQFVSEQVGFAKNVHSLYGRIFKTVDGGNTWKKIFEIEDGITAFHFLNDSLGYFVGDPGVHYKTTDGGATWQKMTLPYNYYLDVKFVSEKWGYVLDDDGMVFKTTDSGLTWEFDLYEYGLTFLGVSGNEVVASGDYGSVFKSNLTLKDMVEIGPLLLENLTDSTAALSFSVDATLMFSSASLIFEIGISPGKYDSSIVIGTLQGLVNQSFDYQSSNLDPGTTYYCRFKIVNGSQSITSKELSFTTPAPPSPPEPPPLVTGVERNDKGAQLKIYPNPTKDIVNVDVSDATISFNYTVTDVFGRKLIIGTLSGRSGIDISSLSSGIYLLELSNREYQKVIRVLKE
ncbi:MAG TPA: T9SS type A sorting domain-containing protein, partial [Chryseolinea sp.]|nr:T9SS type A sorting domain-containing protein [Chryseolinea sp.]